MDVLVWIFAGIFLVNALTVAFFGIVVEVRRRRDQREVRELELLYETPSAPVPVAALRRRGVRPQGKHVAAAMTSPGKHLAVAVSDRGRQGVVRTASLVLAVVSILAVITAALVPPTEDTNAAPMGAASGIIEQGAVLGPRIDVGQPATGTFQRYEPTDPQQARGAIDEAVDVGVPGRNVVFSDGEAAVPAVVGAAPASATSIRIDWAPVSAATGYLVDRWLEGGSDDGGDWFTIAETTAEVSAIMDTGLESATTYYYRVTAMLEGGLEAAASDVVHATTMIAPPLAPFLEARITGNRVVLSWSDVEGETAYRVERLASEETEWGLLGTTEAGVASYTDRDVSSDIAYQYRVIATGLGGDSAPSNVVEVNSIPAGEGDRPSEEPAPDGTEPVVSEPVVAEPVVSEPVVSEPVVSEPVVEPDSMPSG
jgi:fibronectin type 3 domain-containing protein